MRPTTAAKCELLAYVVTYAVTMRRVLVLTGQEKTGEVKSMRVTWRLAVWAFLRAIRIFSGPWVW
jgi:hypothetical protein